jgi:hypothetical protein
VSDATILLRSIAGDAATKTASKVQPPEHQLDQLDQPAEDNTWHEVPDMSRSNLKNQISSKAPFGKKEVQQAVGDASEAAHPSGTRDPAATADLAAQDQQQGTASGVDARAGASAGLDTLKGHASGSVPDEKKNQAKEYRARTQNYLKGKMPQERREQTIWRLKKMVVEIQGHQDCEFIHTESSSIEPPYTHRYTRYTTLYLRSMSISSWQSDKKIARKSSISI